MLRGVDPIVQALLGTLFTWGLTAAGAAVVFFFSTAKRKVLDSSLGFAAGVMIAASYWSLLAPAIELAEKSGTYGENGQFAFIPCVVGFLIGAVFIYAADVFLPLLGAKPIQNMVMEVEFDKPEWYRHNNALYAPLTKTTESEVTIVGFSESSPHGLNSQSVTMRRKHMTNSANDTVAGNGNNNSTADSERKKSSWNRILLLIIAVTVHNIPEGLAVGVAFGAVDKSDSATFESARNLAIGIGLQNFPEGLAVSLPLRGAGFSTWKSFWYGQLSGMVEPISGVLGAAVVTIAQPLLPYALAFAAGAMVYVVVDDIIPEAHTCGNGKLATWGAVIGFVVMMALDVGLG